MTTQTGKSFRLRACTRCGGDAYLGIPDVLDDPEWRCFQCGRMVPVDPTPAGQAVAGPDRRAA
jgi:hypothetical protein